MYKILHQGNVYSSVKAKAVTSGQEVYNNWASITIYYLVYSLISWVDTIFRSFVRGTVLLTLTPYMHFCWKEIREGWMKEDKEEEENTWCLLLIMNLWPLTPNHGSYRSKPLGDRIAAIPWVYEGLKLDVIDHVLSHIPLYTHWLDVCCFFFSFEYRVKIFEYRVTQ